MRKLAIVSKKDFSDALAEMGHNPEDYKGKRISLGGMADLYGLQEESLIEAIEAKLLSAHYDYLNDTIWVDALEAAHFYYCVRLEIGMDLYPACA